MHLFAFERIRAVRGGSQLHLTRWPNGENYVVKFNNNPQGMRTLGIVDHFGVFSADCMYV
jgi:hypothetical protein